MGQGQKGNILLIVLVAVGILAASVGGYFWWSSQKPKIGPFIKVALKDETTNWKMFEFPALKFSLRLPPGWYTHEEEVGSDKEGDYHASSSTLITYPINNPSSQQYLPGQKVSMTIAANSYDFSRSLEELALRHIIQGPSINENPLKQTGDVTVGGVRGILLESQNGLYQEVFLRAQKKSYLISISFRQSQDREELLPIYDQILSTFKFL